jgi:hypothetical protein
MKKILTILMMLTISAFSFAELTTGEEVARAARDRETGDSLMAALEMVLVEKDGTANPVRLIHSWGYTYDKEQDLGKMVMEFVTPASIKGTRFLTVEQPANTDDDKWIYLPALKRVRRIASSDKSSSFVGSDFSYGDMETREVEEDNHKLLKSETINGYDCYVIESTPIDFDDAQYSRRVVYVTKEHYVPVKAELYNKNNPEQLEKVMVVNGEIKEVQGIWTVFETVMTTVETGHYTILRMKNDSNGNPMIKYNVNVDPRRFTQEFLKTGRAK